MTAQTVLVVEDNPITRRMMRFALESEGFRVVEAGDGRTAIAAATASAPGLVLQDYVLPDMDGVQLIEALRLLPAMSATPVLIVTGLVSQIDALRRQALENTTFLPKPIEPSRLVEVVRTLLSGAAADQGGGRRLLIVDDEAMNLRLASLRLRDAGFEVDTAQSGEAALEIARRSLPDAVLSDVLMPGMDGFLLCRAIRRDPVLAHLPVILLSASYVDQDDQKLAFDMGANALLLRTSDLAPAIKALGEAFQQQESLGPRAKPTLRAPDISPLHKERVQIQLERQMARNDALVRQGAIQAAALSVVRGLAEALARPRDLANVLGDVLVHCLDATGVSTGLLYLAEPDGGFHLRAQAGLPVAARGEASASFGHPEVLRRCLDAGYPIAVNRSDDAVADPALLAFVERVGCASALFIPFVVAQERVGVLLLAADGQDFAEPAWLGFARTLAVQFGQTIAVGQSLTRGAASEARYQTIMEQANDAILLLDADRIVEANQQAEALLARPRSEMIGRAYGEFVVPDEGSPAAIVFGGSITRLENQRLRRSDGSIVFADVSASPVRVGEETIAVLILRDITERRRAENRLQESEEQYRLLFDSNPHPMWVYDPATLAFLAVNECRGAHVRLLARGVPGHDDQGHPPAGRRTGAGGLARVAAGDEGRRHLAPPPEGRPDHRRRGGGRARSLFRGRAARLVLVTDVSEKRRLEIAAPAGRRRWKRWAGSPAESPTTSTTCSASSPGYSELLLPDARAAITAAAATLGRDPEGGASARPASPASSWPSAASRCWQPRSLDLNARRRASWRRCSAA